eukprot:CCRYP_003849-RA/>CCRYP_003849-RA protein AED:0.41 eAED:0.41 QI:0/-1/0/1/-1/1/1/0/208
MLTATPYGPNLPRTKPRRTHPSTQPRLQRMKACGIQPTRQVLDNEISAAYKLAITASGMTYQLVPPDTIDDIAEKLSKPGRTTSLPPSVAQTLNFPPPLVPITTTNGTPTLSLRQSNAYPHISSHTHLYGHHDYNDTLSSPGHGSPCPRQTPPPKSFAQHCTKGMSSAHHTSTTAAGKWTPTSSTTISATVFKHKYITNPLSPLQTQS